ncbi:MAG: preprotein translocase subunit YajC [Phycisphaerales bacterium]|nr:preprotein translocase subunit YajC [Phycisphaerales bacterium]
MIAWFTMLAQSDTGSAQPGASGTDMFLRMYLPLILIFVVFWWIMARGKSKERQRYEAMLNALKRNDKVQTISGIIGTVVEVRDSEVVLKVDETTNTKMRFNRYAIKEVIGESAGETGR